MRNSYFILVLFLLFTGRGRAQDCMGYTLKPGAHFELSHFNAKDKLSGKVGYDVTGVRKEGGSTVFDLTAQFESPKGEKRPPYVIHYTCTGNELTADMSGMIQGMQAGDPRNMEMHLKTNKLIYPTKLAAGQKLSDGQMDVDMSNNNATMMTMSMLMSNRQVDGQQSVTTPAGTFETYKINSDVNFETRVMGIPVRRNMRVTVFRDPTLLLDVRSETYDKTGKLMGYSVLTQAK